jgi:response regulator of citrate/malate metabolism
MDYGLPRERIVAAADAFAAEHGRQPYSHELAAALGINRTTANRYRIRFGLKFSRPPRLTGRNRFSKEELVAAIDAFRAEHGRLPTTPELARALGVSPPTAHIYLDLHGLKLLRRPPPTGRYRFTKEELVAAIDAFRAERGRLPTASELGRALGVASATAHHYLDRHGLKLPIMPPPKPRGRNLFTKEELLAAIDAFLAERGRLPTTPELGRALGVASITAHVYLDIHGLKLPQRPSMRYTHLTISN